MAKKESAGIVLYRYRDSRLEIFLVHPGGPFWAKKDLGSWSIPKGEYEEEDPLEVAQREFEEETGHPRPQGEFKPLTTIKQAGGKIVSAWAIEGDCDAENITSNHFDMEWPPHTGRHRKFPEVDRAAWFDLNEAREKILKGQSAFLDELERLVEE